MTSLGSDYFTADVMAETVRRSSLKEASSGDSVNLERAMTADGRFGGHIVSGHIDGTGTITKLFREENAVWITISAKPELLKYIVEKGSVCLDGVSLTVASVSDADFKVSVIPHTGSETTLLRKKTGSTINIENDILAKYIEKIFSFKSENKETLTMDLLRELDY